MNGQWTKEQAWQWYDSKSWIRGCNFMPSDCCNRIDQWQEFGFEERMETLLREMALVSSIGYNSVRMILEFEVWDKEHSGFMKRLDRVLDVCHKNGITAMLVLANDCSVPKSLYTPPRLGEQHVDIGYHGGRKISPHRSYGNEVRFHILDDPDVRSRYYEMVREIVSLYARDPRVIVWNIFNEPGNGRGSESLPYMERFFEICREIGPDQPLCADVWSGMRDGHALNEIQQRALELSDVISYHCYSPLEGQISMIEQLRQYGRPALNTEWLHRIYHNTVEDAFPLYYLEKVGCYNWGFVAGKYQTYEPWEAIWQQVEDGRGDFDLTKWQHDLMRPNLRPYDPREIELIRKYCKKADERFAAGLDSAIRL